MRVLHKQQGITLIEAMVTLLILSLATLVFAAAMPTASKCSRQAQEFKTATALATQKMEQIKSLKYELLTPSMLYSSGIVDSASGSPYYFTTIDQVGTKLTQGTGRLTVTDISSDVKRINVRVQWYSSSQSIYRRVRLVTYIADKRPRKQL